jgi:hypothetical protein
MAHFKDLNLKLIPDEDIKLNSTVFFWPELVMQILEKNQVRLQSLRERTEDKLRDKLVKYDEKLKDMLKRVEAYRVIGVSFRISFVFYFSIISATTKTKEIRK